MNLLNPSECETNVPPVTAEPSAALDVGDAKNAPSALAPHTLSLLCLRSVLADALHSVQPEVDRRGHNVTVALPVVTWMLECRAAQIHEALVHLLIHACHGAGQGGRLIISTARHGQQVLICIVYRRGAPVAETMPGSPCAVLARPLIAALGGALDESDGEDGRRILLSLPLAFDLGLRLRDLGGR